MDGIELRRSILNLFLPPSDMSVSEWADRYRIISGKGNPEPGPWHTDRAPYQKEIMDSFSMPKVHDIIVMSCAQVGKTDMIQNMIGRMIHLAPGPSLMVLPDEDAAKEIVKERIGPTIDMTPVLKERVFGGHKSGVSYKSFPGGFLFLTGSISPTGLKSRPIRYLFMDEVDGYVANAGGEGDPVYLARKRTQNFRAFAKHVLTSTPKLKSSSRIYREFLRGTREEWEFPCKACSGLHHIDFDDIRFEKRVTTENAAVEGEKSYEVLSAVWRCPACGKTMTEIEVKRAKAQWVAYNPKALERGIRSFHLNAFMSPWADWKETCQKFLDSKDNM